MILMTSVDAMSVGWKVMCCKYIWVTVNWVTAKCFPFKVFCQWREIAMTMREKVFEDDKEEEIDVFDLEVG